MAQVKKETVRSAILDAAFSLLAEKGFVATTMAQIAKRAGVSHANVYIYFESKLAVFFAVYETWLKAQVAGILARAQRQRTARKRLHALLGGLLRDLPRADDGFSSNMIQAISTVAQDDPYDPGLLLWFRAQLDAALKMLVPEAAGAAARRARFVKMIIILFDGCSANYHINPTQQLAESSIDDLIELFLAAAEPAIA